MNQAFSFVVTCLYNFFNEFHKAEEYLEKYWLKNGKISYLAQHVVVLHACIYHRQSRWQEADSMFERVHFDFLTDVSTSFLGSIIRDSWKLIRQRQNYSKQELDEIIRKMLSFDILPGVRYL